VSAPLSAREWHARVVGRPARPCAVCGARQARQGHHVVSRERLKQIARDRGIPLAELIYDPDGGMACCELCHSRHTSAFRRIPRSKLTAANWRFINRLDLDWWVMKYYPANAQKDENHVHLRLLQPEVHARPSSQQVEKTAVLLTGLRSAS